MNEIKDEDGAGVKQMGRRVKQERKKQKRNEENVMKDGRDPKSKKQIKKRTTS